MMRVRIVMTWFTPAQCTRTKLYQPPNKSSWRENTTHDISLLNEREQRWWSRGSRSGVVRGMEERGSVSRTRLHDGGGHRAYSHKGLIVGV